MIDSAARPCKVIVQQGNKIEFRDALKTGGHYVD
jgi:hypothetical protein